MSDLGLRYGEEFRPVRELSAGAGESVGRSLVRCNRSARGEDRLASRSL